MTEPTAYKVGDVVQLKSGGSWMTVWRVETSREVLYHTIWMNVRNDIQRDTFTDMEIRARPELEFYDTVVTAQTGPMRPPLDQRWWVK